MCKSIRLFLIAALSLVFVITIHAQQPQENPRPGEAAPVAISLRLIKVSGTAIGASGQPVAGLVGMNFAFYKDQQGGSPLWMETQNVQTDENGNYTALLGTTKDEGVPLELFSTGESRWLGVQAQLPGAPEQPRALLVSVPYALKAADADTLGGLPASAFALAKTADKGSTGATRNETTGNSGESFAVTGGTPNTVAKFAPDGTSLINSSVTDNGNVGVGVSNPAYKLDVAGNIADFVAKVDNQNFGAAQGLWVNMNSGGANSQAFKVTTSNSTLTPFVVTGNGNIGIGTGTPTDKVHVKTPDETNLLFETTGVASTRIKLKPHAAGLAAFEGISGTTLFGSANDLVLAAGAGTVDGYAERMRILANGKVGVGTANPVTTVDVNGAVQATTSTGFNAGFNLSASITGGYTGTSNGAGVLGYSTNFTGQTNGIVGVSSSAQGAGGVFTNTNGFGAGLVALDKDGNSAFVTGANGKVVVGNVTSGNNLAKLTIKAAGAAGAVPGTGTVSVTTGSTTILGTGTKFLSELSVGDRLVVNALNTTYVITAVTDDVTATCSCTTTTTNNSPFGVEQAHFRIDDTGGTTRMIIQNLGNTTPRVGVGTNIPGDNMDVRGTIFSNNKVTIGVNNTKRSLFTVKGITFGTNSGTVSVNAGFTTVSGSGTFFLTQVGLGDKIQIGGSNEIRSVVSITDNTTLNVDSAFTSAQSGVTSTTIPALIRADDTPGATRFIVNSDGNVGVGVLLPNRELEVNGGVRLNTAIAQPACNANTRGTFWAVQAGSGVKDSVQVCAKDAMDAYGWRTIY